MDCQPARPDLRVFQSRLVLASIFHMEHGSVFGLVRSPVVGVRDNPVYLRNDTNIRGDDTVFFGLSLISHIIDSVEFGSQAQPPSHSEQSDAEPID